MKTHPFNPLISPSCNKLLIGTLPPEGVTFYFSNSSNTRLWDILFSIDRNLKEITTGSNFLPQQEKIDILNRLGIGISDIIYKYERVIPTSTKDKHIDPKQYNDLIQLAIGNGISELLFLYQSAYKWFLHSLESKTPVKLNNINTKHEIGLQQELIFGETKIRCILLPSPLNRGRKGETLSFKLEYYKKYILSQH